MEDRVLVIIQDLRRDGGTQTRPVDEATVNTYAELFRDKKPLPAVVAFDDGKTLWLADGFHRCAAAEAAGLLAIPLDRRHGTLREAKLYAASANAEHGLPRTPEAKRAAVMILLEDPEWCQKSDRWIAEHSKVSNHLVAQVRSQLGELPVDRQGKDGKTRRLPQKAKAATPASATIELVDTGTLVAEQCQSCGKPEWHDAEAPRHPGPFKATLFPESTLTGDQTKTSLTGDAATAGATITPITPAAAHGKTTQTTDTDLVNLTAAALAVCEGLETPPDQDFLNSSDPRARHLAAMAAVAISAIRQTGPEGLRRLHEDEIRGAVKKAQGKVLSDVAALLDCEPILEDIAASVEVLKEQADLGEDEEPLRVRCERLEAELEDYKHRAQARLAELTEQIEAQQAQGKPGCSDCAACETQARVALAVAKGEQQDIAALLGCELEFDDIAASIEALQAAARTPGLDDEVAPQVPKAAEEQLAWARAEAEISALSWVAEHLVPPLQVLGATPAEIRQEIEQALESLRQPQASTQNAPLEAARNLGREHAETRRRHWGSAPDELKKLLKEVGRSSGVGEAELRQIQDTIYRVYEAAYREGKERRNVAVHAREPGEIRLGDQVLYKNKPAVVVNLRPENFCDVWVKPQPKAKNSLAREGYWPSVAWESLTPDPNPEDQGEALRKAIAALLGDRGNPSWAEQLQEVAP